ncbi:MAG TPA: D-alanine--D-alanine ligase [Patescibacteria group bacterium]|nr:D-alanine--D-alanine ligase [Patescibacteria group bacterium]
MSKKLKLAVIFGGKSAEHDISINSAKQVIAALNKNKYQITPIKISRKGKWSQNLNKNIFDLVLPIFHGSFGEDGKLQGMLEMMEVKYVFSGVLSSALCMNKKISKIIVKNLGFKIPQDTIIERGQQYNIEEVLEKIPLPLFVKPNQLGSSIGGSIIKQKRDLKKGINLALKFDQVVIIEKYLEGRELTVAVMGNKKPEALPVIEIIPQVSDYFDYRAKYEVGGSLEICPAQIPANISQKVQREAIEIYKALNCFDLARLDFIWPKDSNEIYFIEINTIPGMTKTSLVPKAAKAAGVNFKDLLDKIIQMAQKRYLNEK